jgi:hypothetical protein
MKPQPSEYEIQVALPRAGLEPLSSQISWHVKLPVLFIAVLSSVCVLS